MRERLLGSWRLVSSEWRTAAGPVDSPFGNDPLGLLTYDAAGTVSAQLMRRNPSRFESDDLLRATPQEKAHSWSGYFGYFGTYSLSEDVVTHHVEGSSFPNLVGTDQVRHCRLDGNRLTLDADTPWGSVRIVWEKID